MPHRRHRIGVDDRAAKGLFERHIRQAPVRCRISGCSAGPRSACERDEGNAAATCRNGLDGLADVRDVGRSAGIGGAERSDPQAEIFNERKWIQVGVVACDEVAIDVVDREARIAERAMGDFRVQLCK
jgi:hypothetical protein